MTATGVAGALLLLSLLLGGLGLVLRSRPLGVAAGAAFVLFVLYVGFLALAISRM